MKNTIFLILFFCALLNGTISFAQENVLSGVYVSIPEKIIDGKTIRSYISGTVLDSLTLKPISNASIEIFSTRGDAVQLHTDSIGYFEYKRQEIGDLQFKIVITNRPNYNDKIWQLNTTGMERPIQIMGYCFLSKK